LRESAVGQRAMVEKGNRTTGCERGGQVHDPRATINWMSNKAKVKPLNLSVRTEKGYPNSISEDMRNPSARLAR
ncbi:MAG: hypothetical protein ACKPKO_58915, partial [Candidatus Fonsibacter sp.]